MRYLTFDKYRKLLRDGGLYLARLDRFADPFEGSLPRRTVEAIRQGKAYQDSLLRTEADRKAWAKQFYVSCWYMADCESDAMWRLYCGTEAGVCIVTTYRRLASIKVGGRVLLGAVRYVDYETDDFDWTDDAPVVHKRKAFAHEREVRLISPHVCNLLLMSREDTLKYLDSQPYGYRLGWDFGSVVSKVLVSPFASEEEFDLIERLTRLYRSSQGVPVEWSGLRSEPTF